MSPYYSSEFKKCKQTSKLNHTTNVKFLLILLYFLFPALSHAEFENSEYKIDFDIPIPKLSVEAVMNDDKFGWYPRGRVHVHHKKVEKNLFMDPFYTRSMVLERIAMPKLSGLLFMTKLTIGLDVLTRVAASGILSSHLTKEDRT